MAEYLIQEETLTNLGDKIRVLTGINDTMTPAVMNSELASANEEIDAQSALIDQLSELLDSKASSGSENLDAEISEQATKIDQLLTILDGKTVGSSPSSGFCTIYITSDFSSNGVCFFHGENGWDTRTPNDALSSRREYLTASCGSTISVYQGGYYLANISHGKILYERPGIGLIYEVPETPNVEVTIEITTD